MPEESPKYFREEGLVGKTALITGGSSGLGLAFAHHLGSRGFDIVVLARNQGRIENALAGLRAQGIRAEGYVCDISDEKRLGEVAGIVKANHPELDFLILNAGVLTTKLLGDYAGPEELRKDLEIDLLGVIFSAFFFLPLLKKQSRILMVSSGFGLMGAAGYSVYCAAKAGIVNFAESLRRELLCKEINVYVACPGDMETPQFENEIKNQPPWMKQGSPRKVLAVDVAAKRILKQCAGKRKFLIISSSDVTLLSLVSKLLPRTVRDFLLDGMMPRPKQ